VKVNEADILNGLNVGNAKDVLNGKSNSPLGNLLVNLNQAIIDDLQQSIQARDINASRNLSQGITPSDVIINGNEVEVNISMDFYWKYINYGVNGRGTEADVHKGSPSWGSEPTQTLSFHDSILAWKSDRGLTLPSNFDDYDSFAWAIQNSIIRKGKKPRPFYDDVINEKLVKVLEAPIRKLLGESIKLTIVAPWQ
jgi:hypothetical protein